MKYRKKPVVIEAVQLRWDTWSEMCEHAGMGRLIDGKPEGRYVTADNQLVLTIPTLEGVMVGVEGDWIIRGVAGELYPCKPEIFAATYESAESVPSTSMLSISGEGQWYQAFAAEHDKLAWVIRDHYLTETEVGKSSNPESVFDTAVRLLRAAAGEQR